MDCSKNGRVVMGGDPNSWNFLRALDRRIRRRACEKVGEKGEKKRDDRHNYSNPCFFNVFHIRRSASLHGRLSWFSHAHILLAILLGPFDALNIYWQ